MSTVIVVILKFYEDKNMFDNGSIYVIRGINDEIPIDAERFICN